MSVDFEKKSLRYFRRRRLEEAEHFNFVRRILGGSSAFAATQSRREVVAKEWFFPDDLHPAAPPSPAPASEGI